MGLAIQMHVYNDRIKIWNDGYLPEGYTEETLYQSHPSLPRNPKIANAMFKAGFIDTWGRGYRKIYTGFKESGLPIPTVGNHFSGVQIVIERTTFQRLNSNVEKDVGTITQKKIAGRYNSIKELIASNPYITAVQLSAKLSVSDRTIERDLSKMQELGILIREDKFLFYTMKPSR